MKVELGTGNSSIDNLAFYQKMGFEMTALWLNYFAEQGYDSDLMEDGIACKHMLRFEYLL